MNTICQLFFQLWPVAEKSGMDRQMQPKTIVDIRSLWTELTNKQADKRLHGR